jgi:hypothetical protein
MYPTTPDGRYFVVKGQLWRCTNPSLSEDVRQRLVGELMAARREVKAGKVTGDPEQLKTARARVQKAKVALGGARAGLVGRRQPRLQQAPGSEHTLCRVISIFERRNLQNFGIDSPLKRPGQYATKNGPRLTLSHSNQNHWARHDSTVSELNFASRSFSVLRLQLWFPRLPQTLDFCKLYPGAACGCQVSARPQERDGGQLGIITMKLITRQRSLL